MKKNPTETPNKNIAWHFKKSSTDVRQSRDMWEYVLEGKLAEGRFAGNFPRALVLDHVSTDAFWSPLTEGSDYCHIYLSSIYLAIYPSIPSASHHLKCFHTVWSLEGKWSGRLTAWTHSFFNLLKFQLRDQFIYMLHV